MNSFALRLIDTAKKFILLVACIHLVILFFYAVYYRDLVILNVFNIMDLDLFFPGIIEGLASQVVAFALVPLAVGVIFVFFTKKDGGGKSEKD